MYKEKDNNTDIIGLFSKNNMEYIYKKYNIMLEENDTSKFLLPTIINIDNNLSNSSYPKSSVVRNFLKNYYFVNAYVGDLGLYNKDYSWVNNTSNCNIHLLFNPLYTVPFEKFENKLKSFENWKDSYDLQSGYMVVHVFEVPDLYKDVYRNFVKSQFSKINHDYVKNNCSLEVQRIVFKDKSLGQELSNRYGIEPNDLKEYKSLIQYDKEILRWKLHEEHQQRFLNQFV